MKNALVVLYIDGLYEHRYNFDANGIGEEQTLSHMMDDKSRIATIRRGDAMGDSTPEVQYVLEDHLGSSSATLDETGSWISREEYYPFGETSFGSYGKKRYRFCGKERDEESGLYYYGARYYAPWVCRFVSVDPLVGDYPFYTPYQYSGCNPVTFYDLDGQETADNTIAGVSTNGQQDQPPETPLEGGALSEVVVKPQSFWEKAGDWAKKNVVPNIPVVGGLVSAYNSYKAGDTAGALIGLAEAVVDAGLLLMTGGIGNAAKSGIKAGGKALAAYLAKETGLNVGQTAIGGYAEEAGIPRSVQIAVQITTGIKAGKGASNSAGDAAKGTRRLWKLTDEGAAAIKNHGTWCESV